MSIVWVIPCFNEAERLSLTPITALLTEASTRILLVDDGSTDDTPALLDAIVTASGDRARSLRLPHNVGKGEAVRRGLLAALDADDTTYVGYLDADFSTPPEEAHRVARRLAASEASVAMGARIRRLGAEIDRSVTRHYLGRLFATVASLSLALPVYDTQCGAKAFRVSPQLRAALAAPFTSRWAFDVELLGRLLDTGLEVSDFLEVPLKTWRDVGGSKLRIAGMLRAGTDLVQLAIARRRNQK
ncbi:MAG: dolichyl-phosphate beta-glucosyltransferase [Myxococcota bacterium]